MRDLPRLLQTQMDSTIYASKYYRVVLIYRLLEETLMAAKILDGKAIAAEMRQEIRKDV
jgi:hypothetical protein